LIRSNERNHRRARFGDDIYTELIKIHGLVSQLQVGHPPAAMRIMDHFEKMTPLFNRYLRMSQPSPSLPWQRRTS
jgi:hypothetical protein